MLRPLVGLLMLAMGISCHPLLRLTSRQTSSSKNSSSEIVDALSKANLTTLASFFTSHPTVLAQAVDSPGLKTMLAPNNQAMADIPKWCSGNTTCYEGLMLMHILNGSFYINELQMNPLHTVGHSLLTDATYANLPGGNGQAVAMSLASNDDEDDKVDIEEHVTFANTNITGLATTGRIDEGENVDTFVVIRPIQVGNFSIQPVTRAMTIPGGPLATLKQLGNFKQFVKLLESQNDSLTASVEGMRGVTIFAPTDKAFNHFQGTSPNLSSSDINTILRNHLVASRAVYSPLLQDQGSMVTMAGQNIVFDQTSSKLIVGNYQANVTQFDIMHRGGVIHSIDTVLADVELNLSAASQAAQSAAGSAISGVAGPISKSNAASSQGTDVPNSEQSIDGQTNQNSTISSVGAASTSNTPSGPSLSVSSNSAREHKNIKCTTTLLAFLITLFWLLLS